MPASSVVALGLADAVIAFSRGWAQIMLRNPLHGSRSVLYFSGYAETQGRFFVASAVFALGKAATNG